MLNIIRADIYRIFKNIGIYIAIIFMLLMIGMSVYECSAGSIGMHTEGDIRSMESADNPTDDSDEDALKPMTLKEHREMMKKSGHYEVDREILGANMNLYYIFIFIAAIAVTLEFSGGCIKNTLSSAISRNKYFLSKTIVIFGFCLLLFFLNTYITYFSNRIFNGENLSSSLGTMTKVSLLQLPPVLALISILNGMAFILKKTASYNMIAIPFIMVCQLLIVAATKLFDIPIQYLYYELQIMIRTLASSPSKDYLWHSYLLCAVLIVVCNLAGYLSFKKTEIK